MTPDEIHDLVAQGERAAALMPLLRTLLAEVNNDVVDRQVRLYNGGQLSPELALAGWGEVAVLDRLLNRLGLDIQRAAQARRQMNGRENGTTDELDS